MKATQTTLAATLVVVIAAGLALHAWWTRSPPAIGASAARAAPAAADPRLAEPQAVAASGVESGHARVEANREAAPLPAAGDAPDSSSASAEREWRLEGTLAGLDPRFPFTGVVRIESVPDGFSPVEPRTFEATVAADGSFAARLPGLAPCPESYPWRGLTVTAADPRYVDVEGWVETMDDHNAPRAGPWTFHVQLETRPAALVHGRVVDEEGRPLAGMRVAWQEWSRADEERETCSDASGEYRLTSSATGAAWLRCSVRDPELDLNARPPPSGHADRIGAEALVEVAPGADVAVPDLVLRRGATISGIVIDATGGVVPRALVRGLAVRPAPEADAPEREVRHVRTVVSDASGEFLLSGLVPGPWRLQVVGIEGARAHSVVSNEGTFAVTEVDAPGDGVELEFRLGRVELRVQLRGEPVGSLPISVDGSANGDTSVLGGQTDADGRFAFLGLPGARFQVRVYRSDVEEATPAFVLAADDRERVVVLDLEPRRPRPSLRVRLRDRGGAPIGRAWFHLSPVDSPGAWSREFRLEERDAEADGSFRMTQLEPGRYRVAVRPGGGHYGAGGYFREESFDVELTEPVLVERTVDVRPTGRLLVRAVDERGDGVRALCTLRTLDGEVVPAAFTWEEVQSAGSSPDSTDAARAVFVTPSPAPGRYLLEFTAGGFASRTVEAEVVAGRTTEIVATLAR